MILVLLVLRRNVDSHHCVIKAARVDIAEQEVLKDNADVVIDDEDEKERDNDTLVDRDDDEHTDINTSNMTQRIVNDGLDE